MVQIGSVVVFDRSAPGAPGRTGLTNAETAQLLRFARDASELLLEARRASAGEADFFQPQPQPQLLQDQDPPSQHRMSIEAQILDIDWILNGGPQPVPTSSDPSNSEVDLGVVGNGESVALHEI